MYNFMWLMSSRDHPGVRVECHSVPKTALVILIFLSYQLPWSCHGICAKLQPASDQWEMFKLRKQINPGAFWRGADFHCVWILTTHIMSTFSNKSVISWPQEHATDASYRKTAATKRGCVSSYQEKKSTNLNKCELLLRLTAYHNRESKSVLEGK